MSTRPTLTELEDHGEFARRHIGPDPDEQAGMLADLGVGGLDELIDARRARRRIRSGEAARPARRPHRARGAAPSCGRWPPATRC